MPSSLKLRFIRFFRRAQEGLFTSGQPRSPRGRWVHGSHRESAGILALAAFLSPERPYQLYLPLDHTAAEQLPLLVMIHGCKQDASAFTAGTRMNALADRERFLVLYPEHQIVAQFLHLNRLASREKNPNFAERARTETSHAGYLYEVRDYCFGDRTLLRQVMIDHLAHAWSGGDGHHPYNDPSGPDAATMIWRFFEQHGRMPTPDHAAALPNSENAEQI